MNDDRPEIELNDENLERPWAWLARIPCMHIDGMGNPYAGCAELRVCLTNGPYEDEDPVVPPIMLYGLLPFGPIEKSSEAESMGGYALSADEAAELGRALLHAARKKGYRPMRSGRGDL